MCGIPQMSRSTETSWCKPGSDAVPSTCGKGLINSHQAPPATTMSKSVRIQPMVRSSSRKISKRHSGCKQFRRSPTTTLRVPRKSFPRGTRRCFSTWATITHSRSRTRKRRRSSIRTSAGLGHCQLARFSCYVAAESLGAMPSPPGRRHAYPLPRESMPPNAVHDSIVTISGSIVFSVECISLHRPNAFACIETLFLL
jgi:hypothetical protein